MKVYHSYLDYPATAPSVLTIGNFDGVHVGHQAILRLVCEWAQKRGERGVVFTFNPHPAKLLAKNIAPPLIETISQRLKKMDDFGLEAVILQPFTEELALMTAPDFIKDILHAKLRVSAVFVGYDYNFGYKRTGDFGYLSRQGELFGFKAFQVPPVRVSGIVVSSTKIREFILEGQMEGAALLLGRHFCMVGQVGKGFQRGAQLGFPTANLISETEINPKTGVYACLVAVEGNWHRAVVNIGHNPTFGGQTQTVEAHLLKFNQDIYGKAMQIEFHQRLRDEKRFADGSLLVAQIQQDILTTEAFFKEKGI